jgi:hypothetical protein
LNTFTGKCRPGAAGNHIDQYIETVNTEFVLREREILLVCVLPTHGQV